MAYQDNSSSTDELDLLGRSQHSGPGTLSAIATQLHFPVTRGCIQVIDRHDGLNALLPVAGKMMTL
jgi:hypothetical protein